MLKYSFKKITFFISFKGHLIDKQHVLQHLWSGWNSCNKDIFAEMWSQRSIVWQSCGGARVMCFNICIVLQAHARTHVLTHTYTDLCKAYSGRHACQLCWRALSWLLLNQPFPPQKGACLGEGEGKSWPSEQQTASVEQSQQAGGGWNRVKRNVSKRSLPHVNPSKNVAFQGMPFPIGPASRRAN